MNARSIDYLGKSLLTLMVSAIALFAMVFFAAGFAEQKAYAVGGTPDQTLCESLPGPEVWNANTCTITSLAIDTDETFTIPSGITLNLKVQRGYGLTIF